ncbi:hypothetical protein C0J52_22725 [Blattella germanica]|nr:hypothetical protein C0J52_22725 [Blattella germanica]
MTTPKEKQVCMLEFARCNSSIKVRRLFRLKYQIDPPYIWNIRRRYRQFVDGGCVCKGKHPGRPCVSEVNIARIKTAFQSNPIKSTRASQELQLPTITIWPVLFMKP